MSSPNGAVDYKYAVMRFDDRNRYGVTGVPGSLLFSGGQNVIVHVKPATQAKAGKRNRFAKVATLSGNRPGEAELIELLGPVGDYASELEAYQLHFGIKPCKYPPKDTWGIRDAPEAGPPQPGGAPGLPLPPGYSGDATRIDCTHLHCMSVDNASTRDIDDAISIQVGEAESVTLGIHIADVAAHVPCGSTLFEWAFTRAASAYHGGIVGGMPAGGGAGVPNVPENTDDASLCGGSVPMLPPELAHGSLSLNEGVPRDALSLFLTVKRGKVEKRWHSRTRIINREATTYARFGAGATPQLAAARQLLGALSGEAEPEEMIAWAMIEYNSYFGELLARAADASAAPFGAGLLRVQPPPPPGARPLAASYQVASERSTPGAAPGGIGLVDDGRGHHSLGRAFYAHVSSPIRRYADLHNQHALMGTLSASAASPSAVAALNARATALSRYHAHTSAMELAYRCRDAPLLYRGRVDVDEELGGLCLRLYTDRGRFRIPLSDSYLAEPLTGALREGWDVGGHSTGEVVLELWGVLKRGRTQLRVRLPRVPDPPPADATLPTAPSVRSTPSADSARRLVCAALGLSPDADMPADARPLLEKKHKKLSFILEDISSLRAKQIAGDTLQTNQLSKLAKNGEIREQLSSVSVALEALHAAHAAQAPQQDAQALHSAINGALDGASDGGDGGSGGSGGVTPGGQAADTGGGELDAELLAYLRRRGVSHATTQLLASCSVGLEALTLCSADELVNLVAISPEEAQRVVGVEAAPRAPDAPEGDLLFSGSGDTTLTAAQVEEVMGYPPDKFQIGCLEVIIHDSLDLLAMAPTGSGKTAVALCAILQAFRRGKKAVYTSPIKALSNQKYAEFKAWFSKRGLNAGVALLTGDIKIRSPPGTTHELIICTSEILRNKLVKSPHAPSPPAAETAAASSLLRDMDLDNLGVVVSDEIHYINDSERGTVWEETLMHLPPDVQMVALSATLREPEHFLRWIETARGRPGKIVKRTDRHVPLHVGGIDRRTNAFVQFFGTHAPEHGGQGQANTFQSDKYDALCAALKEPEGPSPAAAAAAGAAKADRAAEKDAIARERIGGRGGGAGRGGKGNGGRGGGGRGGGRGGKGGGKGGLAFSFGSECLRLARALSSPTPSMLPAIVFCMSRKHCVEGAHAVTLNLLGGVRAGRRDRPDETEPDKVAEWERQEEERRAAQRTSQRVLQLMHRKHLQRYMPQLGELDAYKEIMELLNRGVAYHHSGMLPILREFVELCFQQKLVKLVFATETLAVGVNMPARTVVFSQLDKPNNGDVPGHRTLRPDEFWQMAGRAGRRGMDELGFVLYAPTLSVAGLRNLVSATSLREMLIGNMPCAVSQLIVDRPFVLRHLNRGYGPDVLDRTLRSDGMRRRAAAIGRELQAALAAARAGDSAEARVEAAERYALLESRLAGTTGDFGGAHLALNPRQHKEAKAEMAKLIQVHGDELTKIAAAVSTRKALEAELIATRSQLRAEWDGAVRWLEEYGFVDPTAARITRGPSKVEAGGSPDPAGPPTSITPPTSSAALCNALTPRGRACAAFADGQPLIMGTIISDGWLARLSLPDACAWICLFLRERRLQATAAEAAATELPPLSPELQEVYAATVELGEVLEVEFDTTLSKMMLDWCVHKDIGRVAGWLDAHMLGVFVKSVLRVVSYLDVVREVLLGLHEFELYNRLDHHTDLLLGGLVTNESLYLVMAD